MKNKTGLKISTAILLTVLTLMVIGVFASNLVLKHVYDKIDKSDLYWNYNRILEQPYHHLKIEGGNITNIIFEQNTKPSVRVLNDWREYEKDVTFRAFVKNDTLHFIFPNKYKNLNERDWMSRTVLVRLFAQQLLSIDGSNTNLELQKLRQANISIKLNGKSRLEVESYNHNFDTLSVTQADSSQVSFEMSPELKGTQNMTFKNVTALLKDYTLLDIGHGYAAKLNLNLADSAAVILSGKSLKAMQQ
ncbi:hypothetical protein NAF17_10855 [Mucilaginibacter sp. RB4R14]|uniref:hypothetical protein n=1 Tax=Mucilaginibacter aurantiaciroseus TaxID=2949308 RepID=UPI0020911E12|nr:hypothetical protein [Mucilaginibacter aurantiaciroseus]MCO5936039.1 hypothetical protein [Mucilaginibacter aurantiaciroseus]